MEIKILHLFYDLMNLYGEYANVNVIKYRLENQKINVMIDEKSIFDDVDFLKYDFIYVGSGTEKNQLLALEYLKNHKDNFQKAINSNKVFLFTGNSLELLGNSLTTLSNEKLDLIKEFDFDVIQTKDRITGDCIIKTNFLDKELVGFINKQANIDNFSDYNSNIVFGVGADKDNKYEGINKNNLFATYLIGPVLVKNPHFAEFITKKIITSVDEKYELIEDSDYSSDEKGYEITLNELKGRMENKWKSKKVKK